ncbi:unnamed protein product [Victoria cruziana]
MDHEPFVAVAVKKEFDMMQVFRNRIKGLSPNVNRPRAHGFVFRVSSECAILWEDVSRLLKGYLSSR